MKKQRTLFVVFITVFFVICYTIMSQHYDPLARYAYATDENREEILEVVTKQDIQTLIDLDIRPEEFLPFVNVDEFQLRYAKMYYQVYLVSGENENRVVSFVNQMVNVYPMETLLIYLQDYSLSELVDWVNYQDPYNEGSELIMYPTNYDVVLDETYTVGRYEPKDLVNVTAMSSLISDGKIQLREEANEALGEMCSLLTEDFKETCGGLIATQGYISYNEQLSQYDSYLLEHGPDDVQQYFLYPGHNEGQLGMSVSVTVKKDSGSFEETAQYQWLLEHAADYGFIIRYPENKEDVTDRKANPCLLRYVGKDLAQYLVEQHLTLEEVQVTK